MLRHDVENIINKASGTPYDSEKVVICNQSGVNDFFFVNFVKMHKNIYISNCSQPFQVICLSRNKNLDKTFIKLTNPCIKFIPIHTHCYTLLWY
jgi:hypothetical protein